MFIKNDGLKQAIEATERAKGGNINTSLAEAFLEKVGDKKSRMLFQEALRYSLNELCIWDKAERTLYSSLAGKFYGSRGNAVQRANRKRSGVQKKKERGQRKIEFRCNQDGQHEFMI